MKIYNPVTMEIEEAFVSPVSQQKNDLATLQRIRVLQNEIANHVVALRGAADAVKQIQQLVEDSSVPLLHGAMPGWYESVAADGKQSFGSLVDDLTYAANRLEEEYTG